MANEGGTGFDLGAAANNVLNIADNIVRQYTNPAVAGAPAALSGATTSTPTQTVTANGTTTGRMPAWLAANALWLLIGGGALWYFFRK